MRSLGNLPTTGRSYDQAGSVRHSVLLRHHAPAGGEPRHRANNGFAVTHVQRDRDRVAHGIGITLRVADSRAAADTTVLQPGALFVSDGLAVEFGEP